MEGGKGAVEKKVAYVDNVVIQIANTEEAYVTQKISGPESSSKSFSHDSSNVEVTEIENLGNEYTLSTLTSSASPDKPAETPAQFLSRRKPFARSEYPMPEPRSVKPHDQIEAKSVEEYNRPSKIPVSSREENLKSAIREDDEDEDEKEHEEKGKIMKTFLMIEWIAFVCLMGFLIASLTVNKLQSHVIWELKLWKWCVLVLLIFCGRLVTKWFMNVLLFLIEMNFSLRRNLLYFVHGLRTTITVFVWLASLLLARFLLFDNGVKRSKETKILNHITRALASSLVGATLWMVKTFSVKLLAISFLSKRFFNPIQETIFHQYLVQFLSGPPLVGIAEQIGSTDKGTSAKEEDEKKKVQTTDSAKLKKIKRKKVSTWAMNALTDKVRYTKLSIMSNKLDDEEDYYEEKEIKSELEAEHAADHIFANVAGPGCDHIDEGQLCRFLGIEEVRLLLNLFEGAEKTGKIHESDFKEWVVKVYNERRSLSHFIKKSKAATQELDRLFTGIVIVVIVILWLILMKILTSQALVFVISQLVLVAFMFGNTAKNIFEAVIFLFVMHPFDVGDRCVIDGAQMIVEDIRILITTFLRYDNEKVFYPNSVLATKPIINLYRSTGNMRDSVEFSIDVCTSVQTIEALKSRIKDHLKSKPEHWKPHHSVVVREIEDANKMKMALHVVHTINFQNYEDKNCRRSVLVLQLKQIFEELGISKYRVLPQEVHVNSEASAATPPSEN